MRHYEFWTYILTNGNKTVLYTGITNNLSNRLIEHWIGKEGAFTTRYRVYYLVWYEATRYVNNAISLEKTIKHWRRKEKEALIADLNPNWNLWNEEIVGNWPPTAELMETVKLRWRTLGEEALMDDPLSFFRQLSWEG